MDIRIDQGLPFIAVELIFQSQLLTLSNCLLDTGSAGTIFSAEQLLRIGLHDEPNDEIHRIHGVGGAEFVFTKKVDQLRVGQLAVNQFEIEVGRMDYGFKLDGIVGLDFLLAVHAVIDLHMLQLTASAT